MKFQSVPELEAKIEAYFEACRTRTKPYVTKDGDIITIPDPRPLTITGLAVWLDTSREVLLDYEKHEDRAGFSDAIRKAKIRIHNHAEESLWSPKIATGMMFNLVNNWGWHSPTQQVQLSGPNGGPIELAPVITDKLQALYSWQANREALPEPIDIEPEE